MKILSELKGGLIYLFIRLEIFIQVHTLTHSQVLGDIGEYLFYKKLH